jgi:crotonobetainyl-CoA:carnitine CoA-transferase CaiB-like acyl-CoA transferase
MSTADTYAGLRVLELATTIAGPFSTMILADLGADVIKVERPGQGDDARGMPPHWDGESTVFLAVNRNKRSLALDLKRPDGREAFLRLAADADVVVQSFRPGAAERLGLGFEDLRARNPSIVYCSVSAFGTSGSAAGLPGYDPLIQAFSGLMSMTGHPGQPPARVAASLIDLSTGMWAAMGTMAALARRARTGDAQQVEATLVDSGYMLLCHQIASLLATGEVPGPLGSASPITAPYEAFRTADGWIMIAAGNEDLFQRLCRALDLPELLGDGRYATPAERVRHRDALHREIEERLLARPSEDWLADITAAGVPAGPVHDLRQAVEHRVAADRDLLVEPVDAEGFPGLRLVRVPFDDARPPRLRRPPALGEHSEEVLREAGFATDEIGALLAAAPVDAS